MARTIHRTQTRDEETLIAEHLEPHPYRTDPSEWRLKERGVPVWAIIGALTPNEDNALQVACDYGVSRPAVDAARAYYHRHRVVIEARLAANRIA